MTSDDQLLRDAVRRILDLSDGEDYTSLTTSWPSRTWIELERAGMTGVGIEEERGGSGGTLFDSATIVFEVGRHGSLVPLPETIFFARLVGPCCWLGAA